MSVINKAMQGAIKDTFAVIIAENTGAVVADVRSWLDTVRTPQDFFGSNAQGLAEYNSFIKARELQYNNAVRRKIAKV
jgi:hypothetical protein